MVRGAACGHMHSVIVGNAGEIVPQSGLTVSGDELCALFGTKYNVEDGTDIAMWHVCHPLKGAPVINIRRIPSASALG